MGWVDIVEKACVYQKTVVKCDNPDCVYSQNQDDVLHRPSSSTSERICVQVEIEIDRETGKCRCAQGSY